MTLRITTVLFDLDETLMSELPSNDAAFLAVGEAARDRCGIDPSALFAGVRRHADALWEASPFHDYTRQLGLASWEGLWGAFTGDHPQFDEMRRFMPGFRVEAWRRALAECGVDDPVLAEDLSERFIAERRVRHELYPETRPVLEQLRDDGRRLAMVTNGVGDIQWTKINAVGIADYFDAIVISGDHGVGKPDPKIFEIALARVDGRADRAVMVGNSLARDIAGARNAGVRAVWIKTDDSEPPTDVAPDAEIDTLDELPALLD